MPGSRTRVRKATDSNWGNASTPSMALSDLLGGEKKSMGDKSTRSSHSAVSATVGNPSSLIQNRFSKVRVIAKNDRRQEVKNSLAHFLHANQPDGSDVEEEEEEDDSLISDEGDKEELNSDIEKSDGERSQKSNRSRSKRTRKPRRTGGGDDASVVSSASRKRAPRRRVKADADDGTVESRMSRRTSGRVRDLSGDRSVGSVKPMRVQGERQKRSKDMAAPRRKTSKTDKEEDTATPRRTTGKTADEEEDKKPHRSRKKHSNTGSDDGSVSSRKSKGGRRRHTEASRRRKNSPSKSKEDGTGTAPSSPDCPTRDRKSHAAELKVEISSLSNHIEADPGARGKKDPEDASEGSSRFSHEYTHTLLQFDPTNVNNVTSVAQDGAHVTSEKIRHEDGTESELHIHELTGLPTFESQPTYLDYSAGSGLCVIDDDAASQASQEINAKELHEDQEEAKPGKPSSERTVEAAAAQSPGEKSESDEKIGDEALVDGKAKTAKVKRSNSAGRLLGVAGGSRSFLRKKKETPAPSKEEGEEKPSSGKGYGFFGRAKKKDESDSEGEEKDRFGRKKKRTPKNLAHQALDDDGSD
jgi:hypothetical protein